VQSLCVVYLKVIRINWRNHEGYKIEEITKDTKLKLWVISHYDSNICVPTLTIGNYIYVVDKMNRANDQHKIISQGAIVHFIRDWYAVRARECWNFSFISLFSLFASRIPLLFPKKLWNRLKNWYFFNINNLKKQCLKECFRYFIQKRDTKIKFWKYFNINREDEQIKYARMNL